jgi:hypothetical protein
VTGVTGPMPMPLSGNHRQVSAPKTSLEKAQAVVDESGSRGGIVAPAERNVIDL